MCNAMKDLEPLRQRERKAFEAMQNALANMQRRNVVGIYDSSGRALFPEFIAVSLADFNAGRAALADKVKP